MNSINQVRFDNRGLVKNMLQFNGNITAPRRTKTLIKSGKLVTFANKVAVFNTK